MTKCFAKAYRKRFGRGPASTQIIRCGKRDRDDTKEAHPVESGDCGHYLVKIAVVEDALSDTVIGRANASRMIDGRMPEALKARTVCSF